MSAVVEVRGGVIAYGERPVLHGVNLGVEAGEVVAILGANGSGKSTLVRSILGLVPLLAGTIHLFGQPVGGRGLRRAQARRVGYVPQRLGAGSGVPATVGEVVATGRLARRGARPPTASDRAAVAAALRLVGLAERSRAPVTTLSGGQQQRTLIARALAGEPDLLVLDEATAGVDARSQDALAAALREFISRGGTALVVAHELGPLRPLVRRAVVIHHGSIAHDGAVPEPVGHHAEPDHDHVHPHAPIEQPNLWGSRA